MQSIANVIAIAFMILKTIMRSYSRFFAIANTIAITLVLLGATWSLYLDQFET